MKMLKKGAMFGLDARIALAIFGALSVISGAALYSAIQQSKVIAAVADLNEVHKAFEAYWLDTGVELPRLSSGSVAFSIKDLVENVENVSNWKGPYLPYEPHATSKHYLLYPQYDDIQMFGRSINDSWGGVEGTDLSLPSACTGSSKPCGRWIYLETLTHSFADAIDEYVDGTLGSKVGKLRVVKRLSGNAGVYLLDGTSEPTS